VVFDRLYVLFVNLTHDYGSPGSYQYDESRALLVVGIVLERPSMLSMTGYVIPMNVYGMVLEDGRLTLSLLSPTPVDVIWTGEIYRYGADGSGSE
jgi:hypothetical protein